MNTIIVYSPCAVPTSPPLGMAMLDGIKLDLNLIFWKKHINDYSDLQAVARTLRTVTRDTNAKIKQGSVPYLEEFMQKILSYKPDAVGFSILYNQQFFYAIALAKELKKLGIKVKFGGAALSQQPEKYAEYNDDINVRVNDTPDYTGFDKYPTDVYSVLTSYGCAWGQCEFCDGHKSYGCYKERLLGEVCKEIKQLKTKHVSFVDEMILPNRANELADSVKYLGIKYMFQTKPVQGFDFKKLYDSGCRIILWGIESANQSTLDKMKKGTEATLFPKILEDSKRAGIKNFVFIMYNFPGDDFSNTLTFLKQNKNNIEYVSYSEFGLRKNSPMFNHPDQHGIINVYLEKRTYLPEKVFFDVKDRIKEPKPDFTFINCGKQDYLFLSDLVLAKQ